MLSRVAIVLAVAVSSAHAADSGPIVVRGPSYDAATCERIWWSIVEVDDRLDEMGDVCGKLAPVSCLRVRASLLLLQEQLTRMYFDGLCYLWSARAVAS